MDYLDEQNIEVETLESIYYGDFEIISTDPYKFSIGVKCEEPGVDIGITRLDCTLTFTYTTKYPDEAPLIELDCTDKHCEAECLEYLHCQAEESLGTVMIFSLVSAAQEWLNARWEHYKQAKEDDIVRRMKQEEEAEMKRFEGTRVTVETFLKWKKQFEEEMGIAKKLEQDKANGRLTGRELFMTDKTLNVSDLKFLEDGDAVKVDESLFQDLDDLDLEDDEDDDFDPNGVSSDNSDTLSE